MFNLTIYDTFSSESLCNTVVVELRSYFLFLSPMLDFVMYYTVYVSEGKKTHHSGKTQFNIQYLISVSQTFTSINVKTDMYNIEVQVQLQTCVQFSFKRNFFGNKFLLSYLGKSFISAHKQNFISARFGNNNSILHCAACQTCFLLVWYL